MGDARRRHARLPKHPGGDVFGHQAGVLARIVEQDLRQTVQLLARGELVEFDRQIRPVVERTKAAVTLKPNARVMKCVRPNGDRCPNIAAIVAAQLVEFR